MSARAVPRRRLLSLLALSPALLASVEGCRRGPSKIRVGSKNTPENNLLGEIVAQQLEAHAGVSIERKANLGGTFVCHRALTSGDLDCYVEYTGTALVAILKDTRNPPLTDPKAVREEVERAWRDKFDAVWLPPLGFENTFAILVRRKDAQAKGWSRVSDVVAATPSMKAGFGHEFVARADGYEAFAKAYGLHFGDRPSTMDLGLTYRALAEGKVDLIAGDSTAGIIEKLDLVQLADDKHFFPPYEAAVVVRKKVLDANPRVGEALEKLSGKIDASTIRRLNYAVEADRKSAEEVARGFLAALG